MSNQKQLGLAILQYASNFDDVFPNPGGGTSIASGGNPATDWIQPNGNGIWPYVKSWSLTNAGGNMCSFPMAQNYSGSLVGAMPWDDKQCSFSINDTSYFVRYDDKFRKMASYTYPKSMIERWDGMANWGGILLPDGSLLLSPHHPLELYVSRLPKKGTVLGHVITVPVEIEGQGIAPDPSDKTLIWCHPTPYPRNTGL